MIGELQIPILLCLAALVSNLSVFISSVRFKYPIFISLKWISIALLFGNLFLIGVFKSQTEKEAYLAFHLFRCVIFFIPYLFLKMSHTLSGRSQSTLLMKISLAITFIYLLLINIDYFLGQSFLILGWNQYDWGFWPILHLRAKILIGFGFFLPFFISLYLLVSPKEEVENDFTVFSYLLLVWWIGFAFNFLALYGVPIFPFGMVIDTIISAFFSLLLTKNWSQHKIHYITEFLSLFGTTILGFILLQWTLNSNPSVQYLISFIIGMAFLYFLFQLIQKFNAKANAFHNQNHDGLIGGNAFQEKTNVSQITAKMNSYQLTKKEIEIVEMMIRGFSKKQIRFYLDISDGTFRNHLSNLYSKTIDRESPNTTGDKFQRFLYFLSKTISKS
ncbi:helix-turn-helix transcriptional regulator [Leptospira jelokensis]|uniref:helix-turn-helix transcriptional regulator n=1 Tax=Leptospira jelokensis TaxID=2484931 RepID=UPI001091105F|nr:LuxR C-terminal-related transcriptional regulator [Leptospira jelokensis]TGM05362.1 DNA-binding response regulator [Leptospira jelokensis]